MTKFPISQIRFARPTNDLTPILRFYEEGLMFRRIGEFKDHAGYTGVMLGMPDASVHLEFTQHEAPVAAAPPTRDNLLVLYFATREDCNHYAKRLNDLGFPVVEPENPYWLNDATTFEDPDGWRVVLVARPGFDVDE